MKNHFNYYNVPEELIYEKRPYLEDFDVEDKSSINHFIEQRLFDRFNRFSNYEEFVTDLFNLSYYICTMAQAERKPENRFGAYMEYVSRRMHHENSYIGIAISMILLQMWANGWNQGGHITRLTVLLEDELQRRGSIYEKFYCQIAHDSHAGDNKLEVKKDEFCPRKVTYQLLKDINKFWPFLGNVGADERDVKNFIFAIGKTEDEQKLISNFLYNELAPLFKNNDEEKWFFKHIEDEIYKHNHADEIRAKKEQEDAEFEAMMEEEAIKEMLAQQAREDVPRLTKEIQKLRKELDEANEKLKNKSDVGEVVGTVVEGGKKENSSGENVSDNSKIIAELRKELSQVRNEFEQYKKETDQFKEDHTITQEQFDAIFTLNETNEQKDIIQTNSDDYEKVQNRNRELEALITDLRKENSDLKEENTKLKEQLAPFLEFANEDSENKLTGDEEFTLRERIVFFSTVLSLELNKKYTVLSNLATFVSELCKDQNNIVPFISKMKKPEEASANAKAAKKVAGMLKMILPQQYKKDEHLTINKLINSMLLNFPDEDDE